MAAKKAKRDGKSAQKWPKAVEEARSGQKWPEVGQYWVKLLNACKVRKSCQKPLFVSDHVTGNPSVRNPTDPDKSGQHHQNTKRLEVLACDQAPIVNQGQPTTADQGRLEASRANYDFQDWRGFRPGPTSAFCRTWSASYVCCYCYCYVFGHLHDCPFSPTFAHFCPPFPTFGHFWPTFAHFCPFLQTQGRCKSRGEKERDQE